MIPQLLTASELAKLCGVHVRTVRKWQDANRIPFIKMGRSVRFDPDDVQKALKKHTVKAVA